MRQNVRLNIFNCFPSISGLYRRHVQGAPNSFKQLGPRLSLHVFPPSLFLISLPFHIFPILSLPLSQARTFVRIHAHDMHSPSFPLLLFHRLFELIRHFHRPTFPFDSHCELALNTRFLIDFSPFRELTGSFADPIFSLALTAFRYRKTGRLLSIMKY